MNSMAITSRVENLVNEFSDIQDWEDRYRKIIQLGKELPALTESDQIEENRVKGCQSQVWLVPSFEDGRVIFRADSDASIVKGIIALLLKVYSEATPQEILQTPPDFLDTIGLRQHLSMSRANGLSSMVKKISMYAIAYSAKA